jgi:hypothetical protein
MKTNKKFIGPDRLRVQAISLIFLYHHSIYHHRAWLKM